MKCPRDGVELQKVDVLDVKLDKCHRCDGVWFDHGEFEQLRDADLDKLEETIEHNFGNPDFREGPLDGYMRCPACEGRLNEFNYSWVEEVRIDRCEKCYGLWLDDEELNKLQAQKMEIDGRYSPGKFKSFLLAVARWLGKRD